MYPARSESIEQVINYCKQKSIENWSFNGTRAYVPTLSDLKALDLICQKFGIPFEWLCNLINFETAKTFSPAIKNPSSSASGLIQFMAATARDLGTTTALLRAMTFQEQLVYVEKYIYNNNKIFVVKKDSNGNVISKKAPDNYLEADLYMMIFYPAYIGKSLSTVFPRNVRDANPGINTKGDYFNYAQQRAIFKNVPSNLPDYKNWYKPTTTTTPTIAKTSNLFFFILLAAAGYLIFKNK
jgi:hypothetical protein